MASKFSVQNKKWLFSPGLQNKTPETRVYFRKRKLTLAMLSPKGCSLQSWRLLRELLSYIYDAVTGHRDFYNNAKVLHGDISEGNTILTKLDQEDKSESIFIDLDVST